MVNRESEHVLRLWEKSILLMSDSAASLLSSPGVFLARLSSWLQAKSSDHVSFAF